MKKEFIIVFVLFLVLPIFTFSEVFRGDTISIRNFKSGRTIENYWKFNKGDDRSAVSINYDDSRWEIDIDSTEGPKSKMGSYSGILIYRSFFLIDSSIGNAPLALRIRTSNACDVFLDGKLIHSLGVVGKTEKDLVSGFSVLPITISLPGLKSGWHLLAIRTSSFGPNVKFGILNMHTNNFLHNFQAELISMQKAIEEKDDIRLFTIPIFFCGIFIVLSIFHLILFLHYRRSRSNLYYSLFTFLLFLLSFGFYTTVSGVQLETVENMVKIIVISLLLMPLFFLGILYEVFYKRLLIMFWILAGTFIAALLCLYVFKLEDTISVLFIFYIIGSFVETIRVFICAWVTKKEGSRIFIFGLFFPVIGLIVLTILSWILERCGLYEISEIIDDHSGEFFAYSFLMSVSLSMTIYLARDFARMNKKLQEQISEIRQLFDRTVEQENERKKILESQKEDLERMVVIRTEEVVSQKAVIEQKNRDIFDNLMYARRIQEAILPETKVIFQNLKDSFIIYWPKDIVSGDFYSFSQKDGKVIISVADCTGHGVTGAFMSMIGSALINQIVNERGITRPADILNDLNKGISLALKQNESEINDGMDISLCTIDLNNMLLQYAGANRPLWYFRDGTLHEIKADKMAIGGIKLSGSATFSNHEMAIYKGDSIYMFSDGFVDQFGGASGKKLLSKNFKELLAGIQNLSMNEQEKNLTEYFTKWKGETMQVDDILVLGIRL